MKDIVFFTTVYHRPDLLSLQIQLVRKLIPQVTRYVVFNAQTKRHDWKEVMDETERVCDKYGVEYYSVDYCKRTQFKKDAFNYIKQIHDGYMFYMEPDLMPFKEITLKEISHGKGAMARFLNGLLCSQMFYAPTDWKLYSNYADGEGKFETRYESFRCTDNECLPEELRELDFHPNLNQFHEFYGPFFHYDRGDILHYKHEADAKDAFANQIAVMHGCEPFKRSYAHIQMVPEHYIDELGDNLYEMNAAQIVRTYNERAPVIEEANLLDKIKNVTKAAGRVGRAVMTNHPLYVSRDDYDDRLITCEGCPMFDEVKIKCKHKKCGCSLKAKAWLKTESCPMDKWKIT